MAKIIPILALLLMVLHLFKPIGLPGLKRRKDYWKIALLMIAATLFAAALHHY